ncbi:MAG TPA: heme exporter protein CcmD [Gemmobacter sp.]|nr:heme exporter protein CcmD [Gemmobacter sp.]
MMPDLGKYAFAVLASYGVSLALLALLVGWSIWRYRAVKAVLEAAEARLRKG